MKSRTIALHVLLVLIVLGAKSHLDGQAVPTATQRFQLSTFATGTTANTGINSNRNYGVTAGVDLGIHQYFHVYPSFELRGTYPFGGGIVRAKNVLGGVRVSHPFGRLDPYGDILFGRGQINYGAGVPDYLGTTAYVQTPSNVLSPGLGLDLRLTETFFFKADLQLQRYSTPVLASGHVYVRSGSLGLTYRFDFNRHSHRK